MERGIDEEHYDVYDRLHGNFPDTSYGNPFQAPNRIPFELEDSSPSRIATKLFSHRNEAPKLYKSPHPALQQESKPNYGLDDQKIHRKGSNYIISEQDDSFLPDEQSLTLSFDDMRITENASVKNNQNSSKLDCFLNGQSANHLNTIPVPVNPAINASQLLFSAVHGAQKPNSYQPNFHITQPGMVWHGDEDERCAQFNQQYICTERSPSYSLEVHQLQKCLNSGMGPLNVNKVHPFFEFPITRHIERCNQNPFLNGNALHYKSNQLKNCQLQPQGSSGWVDNPSSSPELESFSAYGSTCSVKDFQDQQFFDRAVRKSFPEKMFSRTCGTNTVRVLGPNQSLYLDEKTVRRYNDHTHQPSSHTNGLSQLDYQNYRYSPPDGFDSRLDSQSIQTMYNSVNDVRGRVYSMAKTHEGCRFLQRKFSESSREDIDKIFLEIICHMVELMTHPFGNYLVQKLLELCNEEQMKMILMFITVSTGELFRISCDIYGTRSVQKLIETLKTPEHIYMFLSCLEPDIVSLMKNINGSHVAQRCFQYLSKYNKHLMDAVISDCIELAKDRQGCCALQTCLAHVDGEQKKRLITEITSWSLLLSNDPYGNYVIQFILDLNDQRTTAAVLNQLKGHYEHLSMQKYSSNVVEKCLKLAGENNGVQIIEELMTSPRLRQILQDKYGNYVMQSALSASKVCEDLRIALVAAIRRHASVLRNSPFGKKVLSCPEFSEEQSKEP